MVADAVQSVASQLLGQLGVLDARLDGEGNRARVRAGKPPRRDNPVTGELEPARVDVGTGTAAWPDPPLDPFEVSE